MNGKANGPVNTEFNHSFSLNFGLFSEMSGETNWFHSLTVITPHRRFTFISFKEMNEGGRQRGFHSSSGTSLPSFIRLPHTSFSHSLLYLHSVNTPLRFTTPSIGRFPHTSFPPLHSLRSHYSVHSVCRSLLTNSHFITGCFRSISLHSVFTQSILSFMIIL